MDLLTETTAAPITTNLPPLLHLWYWVLGCHKWNVGSGSNPGHHPTRVWQNHGHTFSDYSAGQHWSSYVHHCEVHLEKTVITLSWDHKCIHTGGSRNSIMCSIGFFLVRHSQCLWFIPQCGSDHTDLHSGSCRLHLLCCVRSIHETLPSCVHQWTLHRGRSGRNSTQHPCPPCTGICQKWPQMQWKLCGPQHTWDPLRPKHIFCLSCSDDASVWACIPGHQCSPYGAKTHGIHDTLFQVGY